jgi:AAT family amino acid transporter
LLFSTLFLYIGVIIAFFAKGHTFDYLMVFPGYTVIIVWALLSLARMKGLGVTTPVLLSFFVIVAIFIGVVATSPILGTVITLFVLLIIRVSYLFQKPTLQS